MRKPRALKPGDRIRVVSPASPVTPERIEAGKAILREAGYEVVLGEHVFASAGYLAGSDSQRAADLNAAFADPACSGVICSRGGYGMARLLPHLDLDAIAASGKAFIGFSDVTTLHLAINRRGLGSHHAPMLLSFSVAREAWVAESFLALLSGGDPFVASAPRAETVLPGTVEGELTGGCLCLLADSIGTPDALDARGKILLLEDVDENPHRVDAMLTHLLNAGKLQEAAGIVIGEMTGTDEQADPKIGSAPWKEIVFDRLRGIDVPTVVHFPCGHMKAMLSLPLGSKVRLDADAGRLSLLEPACS